MRKSIIYYTDNRLPDNLAALCRNQLICAAGDIEIIYVSLGMAVGFWPTVIIQAERGILTMHRQILAGLEAAQGDCIFLAEHDVYYHPSHFDFVPLRPDIFYYNINMIHVRWPDGYAVAWDDCQQVSGLCASRELLLDYYQQRIAQIEREGFNRHYEPGLKQAVGGQRVENWKSEMPNLDIRHGGNLTRSKWRTADFRNQRYTKGWREMAKTPGWDEIVLGYFGGEIC